MVYNEFLAKLTAKGNTGKWFFYGEEKALRHYVNAGDGGPDNHLDPLTFVCVLENHHCYFPTEWSVAARALGLDMDVARSIVFATDSLSGYDPSIRQELMTAIGLNDPPK